MFYEYNPNTYLLSHASWLQALTPRVHRVKGDHSITIIDI